MPESAHSATVLAVLGLNPCGVLWLLRDAAVVVPRAPGVCGSVAGGDAQPLTWLSASDACRPDEALEAMPYTDAVLREVMRTHGIVDGLWRRALEDLEVQGRRVPKVRVRPCLGNPGMPGHVRQPQGCSTSYMCPWAPSRSGGWRQARVLLCP